MTRFHLHLVSDSTGETLEALAKAALVQFKGAEASKHAWPMIRNLRQLERVIEDIREKPGLVLFTLVHEDVREQLISECESLKIPYLNVLEPAIGFFARNLGEKAQAKPGQQHALNAEYFDRIEAMNYTLTHDDGQISPQLNQADVVLVGVSRTSKTPTCIYLANRGIKAANIPVVRGCSLPPELFQLSRPLIVGLITSPDRLVQIRRARLKAMNENRASDYADPDAVKDEMIYARRIFSEQKWPVIDVTRRSIEETAAAIMNLMSQRQENGNHENGNGVLFT